MQAKKLAAHVAELRNRPDDKRCFDCEQLGTTYYVPQLSIFVCTPCSGVHMQFGHRVKSVTLADYSAHEVEQMQQGGNQVAAYRWLARYTPGKDVAKPTDRNPQKIRQWVQTVFVDKRYFSADAPIPRRSTDSASSAATAAGLGTGGGSGASSLAGSSSSFGSSSFRRSSSAREGGGAPASPAARSTPVTVPTSPTVSRQQQGHSASPPVHDVREILGDKAAVLHVVAKGPSDGAAPATAAPAPAPAAPPAAVHKPAPAAVFDPFGEPTQPVLTPAMQPVQAAPAAPPAAGGFDPFQQQQQQQQQHQPHSQAQWQQQAAPAAAAVSQAPASAAGGWASFDEAPAFPATPQPASNLAAPAAAPAAAAPAPAPAAAPAAAVPAPVPAPAAAVPGPAAETRGLSNGGWADFGGGAVSAGGTGSTPAAASAAASTAAVTAGAAAAASSPAATSAGGATGTPKGGKLPAKELAPDLFSDFAMGGPAAGMLPLQYQQQAALAAAGMRPPLGPTGALQQQQQLGLGGFGMGGLQQGPQVPAHLAWQVQQQAALQWQYQQQVQQQQQQQQPGAAPGFGVTSPHGTAVWGPQPGYGAPGMFGMPGAVPGQVAGAANGVAPGMYGAQQPPVPYSGPASAGSGPTSGGSTQWTLAAASAGVTEQNAFADLVDLKSALPSGTPASSAQQLQQQQQQSFGQMMPVRPPAATAGYGGPGMMQPQFAGVAGYSTAPGGFPQQQQPGLQQPGGVAAAGLYSQQQPQWGMPPAAVPGPAAGGVSQAADEGNPFA